MEITRESVLTIQEDITSSWFRYFSRFFFLLRFFSSSFFFLNLPVRIFLWPGGDVSGEVGKTEKRTIMAGLSRHKGQIAFGPNNIDQDLYQKVLGQSS